ncbi:MAG: TolC family protein, partial [Phycisphaeraceae bacterium]|nr:TolC family protein [Phycisphaeraceae bacterium]
MDDDALSGSVVQWHRKNLRGLSAGSKEKPASTETPQKDLKLESILRNREELDRMSGPNALVYRKLRPNPGPALDGSKTEAVTLSLDDAVRRAVDHNLDVKVARLAPGISQAQFEAAEAAFDFVFFLSGSYGRTDRPQPTPVIGGIPVGTPVRKRNVGLMETGIRKPLESGGAMSLSFGSEYVDDHTPGFSLSPDPSFFNDVTLDLTQPLLRNYGREVNRAQIDLTANLNQRDRLALRARMLQTVSQVEEAYWQLAFARQRLIIRQRVLEATIQTRDTVFNRRELDGGPVQQAQAQSSVEAGRRDVLEAQTALRDAADVLKQLLNDPELPLSGETLVQPSDKPISVDLKVSLLDAVTTALRRRPAVRSAMTEIKDANIRLKVAENQELPMLDLNTQVALVGLGDGFGSANDQLDDGRFLEYLIGLQFESPFGNRAAEANARAAKITRTASIVRYKSAARGVVLQVKQAMRRMRSAWRLIGVNRNARLAAAENLRALREQAKTERLTPT